MITSDQPPRGPGIAPLQALGAELVARDRWSRSQLIEFQRDQLRSLLAHAVQASPYYRDVFGPNAANVPLSELPTLPKATLMDNFDRIVTDPALQLSELEAHVTSAEANRPFRGYRVFSTSGTAGLRGLTIYSHEEFALWTAASLRLFAWTGITPQTRLVAIGSPDPVHITNQLFSAFRSGRQDAPRVSVLTPIDEIVAALNEYQPEALVGYTSVGHLLAQQQLDGRLRIQPRVVALGSEVLTGEATQRIREAWRIEPVNVYASTEVLFIATSRPPHTDLHIYDDLLIIEVVDEHNRPVPPGKPGFKVLVTNLVNRVQPLIRYELSDSVVLAEGPDPSGLPYGRFASVDGRSDDVLRLSARAGGELPVYPYRLRAPFSGLSEVRQYQIIHDESGLQVRVVLQPAASPETLVRVREALLRALDDIGALAPSIEVVPVASIEREAHGSKLKLIKSRRPWK